MNSQRRLLAALPLCASLATALLPLAGHAEAPSPERGRYIAMTSGCNDCHTAGYMPSAGRVPESEWLKGDAFGWSGGWGTTYASNLRLFMSRIDEEQWVDFAVPADTDILVNATSIGLYPNVDDIPNIDLDTILPTMFVQDVIPNPAITPFLRAAQARGARWNTGTGMLINQAALNIEMWTGLKPDKSVMLKALQEALS